MVPMLVIPLTVSRNMLLFFLLLSTFKCSWTTSVPYKAETQITMEESPAEAFSRSDINKDGLLNFDEFLRTDALFEALKRDEFSQLDLNGDGKVSRIEYYPGGGWYTGWLQKSLREEEISTTTSNNNKPQMQKEDKFGTPMALHSMNKREKFFQKNERVKSVAHAAHTIRKQQTAAVMAAEWQKLPMKSTFQRQGQQKIIGVVDHRFSRSPTENILW